MPKISQRDALEKAFLNLCEQYSRTGALLKTVATQHNEIGEELKTISELISPFLNGEQKLTPKMMVDSNVESEDNPSRN